MLRYIIDTTAKVSSGGPIEEGDPVVTPAGPGVVLRVGQAIVSVRLDSRRGRIGYAGTVFPVGDVRALVN